MNSIMTNYWHFFALYQALRAQVLSVLTDQDLKYAPGGSNLTLGALCVEIGETEQAYIESFKNFKLRFNYGKADPALAQSVAKLEAWYAELDQQLQAAIEALSDEDIQNKTVDRGGDFVLPPQIQLEVYKEALLIFYGKVSVYLKVLAKELPPQFHEWIA